MDYSKFLNSISSKRTMSPLRNLFGIQVQAGPNMISLGLGRPNSFVYPFESVTIKTKHGTNITLENEDLQGALDYCESPGLKGLIDWLVDMQKLIHDPPYARDRPELNQLIITPGSEDAQCKILEMILEPGDSVIMAEPAYSGLLSMVQPMDIKILSVEMDQHGVIPEDLQEVLEKEKHSEKLPKIFILQPNHCNPTGINTSVERKKEIYRLACKYDILLIEDDPYYFLGFHDDGTPPPSLLSMDTEGRVLRLDSFSKVISAGFRLGTLSGPRPIVQRIIYHQACSTLHASTFNQVILYKYLLQRGQDGYMQHLRSVADFYKKRCHTMLQAAHKHLTGLAEWSEPDGGMFLWIKVNDIKDTETMVMQNAFKRMVMLVPGCFFMCDVTKPTPYLRASFSKATETEIDEGFRRLAEMIKEQDT